MRIVENVLLFFVMLSMGISALWVSISGRAKFKERNRNAVAKARQFKKLAQDFANTPVSPAEFRRRMRARIKRKR
ncbi:MAG: hypothetical protein ACUZ8H_05485 [Candidatus Anammoxibacter sp.]